MTWFDALLITFWGMMTALGIQRGVAGLIWGVGTVAAAFLANLLGLWTAPAAALAAALVAGGGISVVARLAELRLRAGSPFGAVPDWEKVCGALGGFLLGSMVVSAIALSFPTQLKVDASGARQVYPATSLPPVLYRAVDGSAIKQQLAPVWEGGESLRLLLIPDQVHPAPSPTSR